MAVDPSCPVAGVCAVIATANVSESVSAISIADATSAIAIYSCSNQIHSPYRHRHRHYHRRYRLSAICFGLAWPVAIDSVFGAVYWFRRQMICAVSARAVQARRSRSNPLALQCHSWQAQKTGRAPAPAPAPLWQLPVEAQGLVRASQLAVVVLGVEAAVAAGEEQPLQPLQPPSEPLPVYW